MKKTHLKSLYGDFIASDYLHLLYEARVRLMIIESRKIRREILPEANRVKDLFSLLRLENSEENFYKFITQYRGVVFYMNIQSNIDKKLEIKRLRSAVNR